MLQLQLLPATKKKLNDKSLIFRLYSEPLLFLKI